LGNIPIVALFVDKNKKTKLLGTPVLDVLPDASVTPTFEVAFHEQKAGVSQGWGNNGSTCAILTDLVNLVLMFDIRFFRM
jgi:hypothetical protein